MKKFSAYATAPKSNILAHQNFGLATPQSGTVLYIIIRISRVGFLSHCDYRLVFINKIFYSLAGTETGIFEQPGWHRMSQLIQ